MNFSSLSTSCESNQDQSLEPGVFLQQENIFGANSDEAVQQGMLDSNVNGIIYRPREPLLDQSIIAAIQEGLDQGNFGRQTIQTINPGISSLGELNFLSGILQHSAPQESGPVASRDIPELELFKNKNREVGLALSQFFIDQSQWILDKISKAEGVEKDRYLVTVTLDADPALKDDAMPNRYFFPHADRGISGISASWLCAMTLVGSGLYLLNNSSIDRKKWNPGERIEIYKQCIEVVERARSKGNSVAKVVEQQIERMQSLGYIIANQGVASQTEDLTFIACGNKQNNRLSCFHNAILSSKPRYRASFSIFRILAAQENGGPSANSLADFSVIKPFS